MNLKECLATTHSSIKKCNKCGKVKNLDKFAYRKDTKKYRNECKCCTYARYKKWKDENIDTIKRKQKEYYVTNREKIKEVNRKRHWNNREEILKKKRDYWNRHKEKNNKKCRDYKKNNKNKINNINAKRRCKKLNAIPPWTDLKAIKEFYKNCPEGYHVDHIYPLKHKDFCGLHVPWNIQYITKKENLSKSNKRPEEFYGEKFRSIKSAYKLVQRSKTKKT